MTPRAALRGDTYFSGLARVLCGRGTGRYLAMLSLSAKCDESYNGTLTTTPIYVVAGWVAREAVWEKFDELWRESMASLGIQAIGCHASKCANGKKPYDRLSPEKCREIQHRLLVDIVAARLLGCVAVSDLAGFRKRKARFDALAGKDWKKYNEPHVLAASHCVGLACKATASETQEPIAFIFDQNNEFGGRARDWYRTIKNDPARRHPHSARLGAYAEDDRMKVLGLQAADILAYSAFRHFSGKPSWQWDALDSVQCVATVEFGESYWQLLEETIVEAKGGKPDTAGRT